jgi:YfiH family protein
VIAWRQRLTAAAGEVHLATTDREGGVSREPWAGPDGGGLNLAGHVEDDAADVLANRRALAGAIGVPADQLVVAEQVHGRDVVEVSGPCSVPPIADALVTRRPGLVLCVLVADCVPVLLADPDQGVLAVAHAGRPGLVAGVVPAAVAAMRDLGARDVVARLGPSVCPRCYEVPLPLREQVASVEPVSRSVSWTGSPAVDVAAGVLAQLDRLGVAARQLPGCTVESPRLYSYRRDGLTGRFAGLVWRDEAA